MTTFSDSIELHGPSTSLEARPERAVLVGIDRPGQPWPLQESLEELARLVETAGGEVVATTTQKLSSPNPKTFIGTGKAQEVAELARIFDADLVVFDDELTPSQQSNLEHIVDRNVKVIDRTALILDIFALHATTKEGRLQVRLAQNQYLYPRLRGMWAHLASNRMGGGVGSRFGEGESQLEVDRRMVRKRITSIRRELEQLSRVRSLQRETRYRSGIFKVAFAGYTNAGKSSLLNTLTGADILSYDQLFATLDSTTRRFDLPDGREITLTDTVGFIQKLPTTLIEAFKSTLDEITGSDLICHIIDSSSPVYEDQIIAVQEVLDQIGAQNIPCLTIFNKIDLLDEEEQRALRQRNPHALFISSKTGEGLPELISRIAQSASAADSTIQVCIPYQRGELVSTAHDRAAILSETYDQNGTHMVLRIGPELLPLFEPFKEETEIASA